MATKKRKVDQEDDLLSTPNHDIDPQCLDSFTATVAGGPVAPHPDVVEDDEANKEEDVGKLLEPHLRRSPLPHLLPYGAPSLIALAIFSKPSSLSSLTLVSPSLTVSRVFKGCSGSETGTSYRDGAGVRRESSNKDSTYFSKDRLKESNISRNKVSLSNKIITLIPLLCVRKSN